MLTGPAHWGRLLFYPGNSHYSLAGTLLHSSLASRLSPGIMAHAILQTSRFALILNPLYSFHHLSPTPSLSSTSSSLSWLMGPAHTKIFLPFNSYKSCQQCPRSTLNLITHWVLYPEAFILWQVWLPTLIFSKMSNLSLIALFLHLVENYCWQPMNLPTTTTPFLLCPLVLNFSTV